MSITKLSLSLACGGLVGIAAVTAIPKWCFFTHITAPVAKKESSIVLKRDGRDFIVSSYDQPRISGEEFWIMPELSSKYACGDKLVLGKDIEFEDTYGEKYLDELRG